MSKSLRVSLQCTLGLVVLAAGAQLLRATTQDQTDGHSAVVTLTAQQDHDRQMRVLKISGFPPGPDAYQAATYDEATATPYPTLPDPLVMNDTGRPRRSASMQDRTPMRRTGRCSSSSRSASSTETSSESSFSRTAEPRGKRDYFGTQ